MRRSRSIAFAIGTCALVVVAIAQAGPFVSKVEQADYTVERSDGRFEIRSYPAMIVAQVNTRGERKPAIGEGFRMIAGYIFGGNHPHQKVAMTAPVLQQRDGPDADDSWTVRFVMPRKWTLSTLPKPDDPRVTLVSQPAATFAVIRFAGLAGDKTVAEKTRALNAFITRQRLRPSGLPILAFFDPPWILPFLRRNEIMIAVSGI